MSWTGKNMYIPEIVMLCGIPCSGKSTYVNKLLTYEYWENSIILSTDNYIEEQAKRLGMTYNEVFQDCIDEATRQLEMSFVRAKEEGKRIIWDQTNLSIKTRKKKLTKVPSIYKRTVVWFQVDLEEALKRNETRKGKFIPESILKRMYHQFEVPTLEEGFDFVSCGND
jgi:predicted kinase